MRNSVNECVQEENAQIAIGSKCYGTKTVQRIGFIDIAKTFCIFLMIVGHWTENEMLWRYIYSFHIIAVR